MFVKAKIWIHETREIDEIWIARGLNLVGTGVPKSNKKGSTGYTVNLDRPEAKRSMTDEPADLRVK